MTRAKSTTTLDDLIARADELRAKGFLSVALDGVAVTLAPAAPTSDAPAVVCTGGECTETRHVAPCPLAPTSPTHIDPMQDPASYQGGVVPGFKRPKD